MNERIRELAEQSMLVYRDGDTLLTGWMSHIDLSEYIEKFAELIVEECIEAHADYYGVGIIGDVLKEHFGIKK